MGAGRVAGELTHSTAPECNGYIPFFPSAFFFLALISRLNPLSKTKQHCKRNWALSKSATNSIKIPNYPSDYKFLNFSCFQLEMEPRNCHRHNPAIVEAAAAYLFWHINRSLKQNPPIFWSWVVWYLSWWLFGRATSLFTSVTAALVCCFWTFFACFIVLFAFL